MNSSTSPSFLQQVASHMQPVLPGLLAALCTLLFGFILGIVFGLNEDIIKSRLATSGEAARTEFYSDSESLDKVLAKSWVYMQRAHLHAGSLGTAAIAMILLVVFLKIPAVVRMAISLALGLGGLGYSVYWLWAGFRAPGLGGTDASKESLSWLAIPSSGAIVLGTLVVAAVVLHHWIRGTKT